MAERGPSRQTGAHRAARPPAKAAKPTAARPGSAPGAKAGPRGTSTTRPATKARAAAPPARRASNPSDGPAPVITKPSFKGNGRLNSEILGPLGLGALVMVGILGLIASVASHLGPALALVVVAAGTAMSVGLVFWVGLIVHSSTARPLRKVRAALQLMEEGNYDTRLQPEGAYELADIAHGFNSMATIVQHQRERLKVLASTDPLTGLSNHRHFYELLHATIQSARDEHQPFAVVAIDIDGFKQLNDSRGHSHGDEALRAGAGALLQAVRNTDLVARLGGDDFMLLLPNAQPSFAREVAERARDALARCLPDDPELTTSAGFVCLPEQAAEESNVAELAIEALEVAKRAGGNQTRKFDPDQVAALPTIKQQRAEIDVLLEAEAPITPVFQPLVELATGRLIGYEALSRFNTEEKRAPDAWFSQAERCGRSLELEAAAIRAALAAGARPAGTYLTLNFSPSAICSKQMLSLLPKRLNDVVIEITEHELAAQDDALEEGLERLRARGARIAVDDAGAGYAGLNQVMRVQPDIIKLDRSLIEGVHTEPAKAALIEFFVMFARRVGAAVCTEGIETIEELRALLNLGVAYGQGYLLGRPAEPWAGISEEIFRLLSTGALRVEPQPFRIAAPPPPPAAPGSRQHASVVGAPVNRRLARYRAGRR